MARNTPRLNEVKLEDVDALKNAIRAKVTGSTLYVSKLKALAQRRAEAAAETASAHYEAAISSINEILQEGPQPANAARSSVKVRTPSNSFSKVSVSWAALSDSWLTNKATRSSRGWKYNRNRATKNYETKKPWRGRSHGANKFWMDEKKLARYFKGNVGRGKASVEVKLKEMNDGTFEVTFEVKLNKLPARYLDKAIRRSLIQGAVGMGSLPGLLRFEGSEVVNKTNPQGLERGMWPEAMRPTMRPVAQRIGRAMKLQLIKSLNRR